MNEPNSGYGSQEFSPGGEGQQGWEQNPTGYQTDKLNNGYLENPHEGNFFDHAYSETWGNPNPHPNQQESSGWELG